MTEDDGADAPSEHGITEADMEQITAFLAMSRYERSVDDLRPSSKE